MHYCDHAFSVVRRLSVVNFSHFRLLFWNRGTEFNETWQEAKSQRPLPSLCFSDRSERIVCRPCLLMAEIFSTSPVKTAERNSTKLEWVRYQVCAFRADKENKMAARLLNGWDIFDFSSETAERNSTKLDRKQYLNVLYQICAFVPIGKTRWPPRPLIRWDIFDFSAETAEWNSTKLNRKQGLNVLYQVCVFRADRINKMADPASDLLIHFRLLLW